MTEVASRRADTQNRIVDVAARLLQEHGAAAVTTRRVAEAAGVQAPTIYRLFGDKDGLLDAVAEHALATFVAEKAAVVAEAAAADVDPLEDLRAGWRTQIDFAVANPDLFRLLSDPSRARHSPAAVAGQRVLASRVHRLAEAGRLRVGEQRAVDLVHAAGTGVVLALLAVPADRRDPDLADVMLEAVLRQVLDDVPARPAGGPLAAAVAFRAVAPGLGELTDAERGLLREWLDRVIAAG